MKITVLNNDLILSNYTTRGNNNFDLIRSFLAVLVIFGHSFYLFSSNGWREPITILVENNFSGTLAVGGFFFISGIFISQSFHTHHSIFSFVVMRIARLYPALIICIILSAFLLGPVVSKLSYLDYISNSGPYCYFLKNWLIIQHYSPNYCSDLSAIYLPGVFQNNFFPNAVNGSLWTLKPEIICYCYLLIFGIVGVLNRLIFTIPFIFILIILQNFYPDFFYYFNQTSYSDNLKIALCFLSGVFAFSIKSFIKISFKYFLFFIFLLLCSWNYPIKEYFLYLCLFYGLLILGSNKYLLKIKLSGDYSYGIYIYGFPIQQIFNHFFPSLNSYPSNLFTIPSTILIAYFSWHIIEKPSLFFARKTFINSSKEKVYTTNE